MNFPRRVFQSTYAAYLNLIEVQWEVLGSLALKGRRFETWEQIMAAVQAARTGTGIRLAGGIGDAIVRHGEGRGWRWFRLIHDR